VPYFTSTPNARAIWTSVGEKISHFHERSGLACVEQRIHDLSERDLDRQLWYLRASFTSLARTDDRPADVPLTGPPAPPAPREDYVHAARLVAERLERLAFVTDAAGVTYAATDGPAYELLPWWDTPPANLIVVVVFAVTALTAVLGLPPAAALRRLRNRPARTPRAWRAGRLLAGLAGAVGLAFVVMFTLVLTGDTSILYGVPTPVRLVLLLPPLFLALTVAAITTTVIGWRNRHIGVLARVHQVTLLAGMLALVWFCLHWNLLGWQFG
jgi:hypothetical protein